MIVVVGVPALGGTEPAVPAGRSCEIALAAARRGRQVELVGRIGDDPAGDALLIALSAAGVGHVAMLRDAARATPIFAAPPGPGLDEQESLGGEEPAAVTPPVASLGPDRAPRLEPADVSLGLEYLVAFNVLVVADDVPDAVVPVAIEAAGFAGAHLVLLLPPGSPAPAFLPESATALAAPAEPDEGAFAALVGAYAAALDTGAAPAESFAAATGDTGWEALAAGS